MEKQVHLAQHALVQANGHIDHGAKPRFGAMLQGGRRLGAYGDHPQLRGAGDHGAVAVARMQALLVLHHVGAQAAGGQHHKALVGLVGPAHRHAIGARNAHQPLRKILRQRVQRSRMCHHGRYLVQGFQALALFFQLQGLFLDLGLEVAVHELQVLGHAVKAVGQGAKFVRGNALDPRAPVAGLDFFNRLLEQLHRLEHKAVARHNQHGGTNHGQ